MVRRLFGARPSVRRLFGATARSAPTFGAFGAVRRQPARSAPSLVSIGFPNGFSMRPLRLLGPALASYAPSWFSSGGLRSTLWTQRAQCAFEDAVPDAQPPFKRMRISSRMAAFSSVVRLEPVHALCTRCGECLHRQGQHKYIHIYVQCVIWNASFRPCGGRMLRGAPRTHRGGRPDPSIMQWPVLC